MTSGPVASPHRLASELKADLRDQIGEKRISTEEHCLDWLEQEERADAPHQTLDYLWSIPLNLERAERRDGGIGGGISESTAGFRSKWKIGLNQRTFAISCEMYYHHTGRSVWKTKKRTQQRSAWLYALCRQKISIQTGTDALHEEFDLSGGVLGHGRRMFAAAQQRGVETWREAEDADDPSPHELGLNSPICERGIKG